MQSASFSLTVERFDNPTKENLKASISKMLANLQVSLRNKKLLLKPNFVCPRPCATTNMDLVKAIIEVLSSENTLVLGEGSGYEFDTEKTFDILKVRELGKQYKFPIVNLRTAKTRKVKINGKVLKTINLPEIVCDVDYIINMPKIKTHALTDFTCAMKNLIGLLPEEERRKAHVLGLHQSIVDLSSYFNSKIPLTICDGIEIMSGEGPAFGDMLKTNFLLGGTDLFLTDFSASKGVGINPFDIKYLRIAKSQGHLSPNIQNLITEPNIAVLSETKLEKSTVSKFYRFKYWSVYAFDSGFSHLAGHSLIPKIITKFGTNLKIDTSKCEKCAKCIEVCPVKAIRPDYTIDFEKCRHVRCFRCFELCPVNAVSVTGRTKPKEGTIN